MMRNRFVGRSLLATALVVALLPAVALASPASAEVPIGPGGCAGMTVPEENHASIRLRVDQPASDAQVAVDEHGKITITGILHKQATMVDVSDGPAVSSDFVLGPPPDGVAAWAASWTTSLRPPHLGPNQLCARAVRDPKRSARILRSFTVVDLIPPSAVPGLAVGNITATGAKATWGEATDNYGLAGYEITVDGGTAHRTTVGTRSYPITGLAPSTQHTVSVVAVDLAGNRSTTPATASFTTAAAPPPPDPDLTLDPEQGGASAVWHPLLSTDVSYRVFLDGQPLEDFPLNQYCQNANGNPASPCTAQDVISYPIEPLEEGTPYTFRVDALRADGTVSRTHSSSFTTLLSADTVPAAVVQQVASESSQCAGTGGGFYVSPTVRGRVPVPAGSTQVSPGCYTVPNNSCIDRFLPPSGNKLLDCSDDVTTLLRAVAPAGHGPVISSLDGVSDYSGTAQSVTPHLVPPSLLVEPIAWCVETTACTVVLAPAAETVETVAVAGAAAATFSWIAVIGAGIGIGIALGVLLAILFPTEIAIAGLLEYPIEFNTNFDTFDNWSANKGEWYDSLKIYAEMIKTTNQLAGEHNIPFAWNAAEDRQLRETIDTACTAQQGTPSSSFTACGNGFAVYVPGGLNYKLQPMNQTGAHIVAAMGNGGFPQPPQRVQWFYPARSEGGKAAAGPPHNFNRKWYDTDPRFLPPAQDNACFGRPPGLTCDEFPFWTTDQAVNLSGVTADLARVPNSESLPQATDNSGFYGKCKVKDTDRFLVLPIPAWVAASGPSFGFRVDQDGTSLCMAPGGP